MSAAGEGAPSRAQVADSVPVSLAITFAIQTMVAFAVYCAPVMAPVAGPALGVSPAAVGYYIAASYLGSMLGSAAAGGWVARFGPIRVSQAGLALCCCGLALAASGWPPVVMLGGFIVNLVSGLVLFATAPVGFVRNVTFLVKLTCVILAAIVLWRFLQHVFRGSDAPDVAIETPRARRLFAASSTLWVVAITAGRLTAYSAYVISRTLGAVTVAFLVAIAAVLIARALLARRSHHESLPSSLAVSLKGK